MSHDPRSKDGNTLINIGPWLHDATYPIDFQDKEQQEQERGPEGDQLPRHRGACECGFGGTLLRL